MYEFISSIWIINNRSNHEGPTFIMFGIIFILVALWQLIMFGSSYYDK